MIWLAQLLCPERHAIIAVPFEEGQGDPMIAQAEEVFKTDLLYRRCGICGSTQLKWERGRTRFQTIEQALVELKKLHEDQMATRAYLDLQGLTVDARRNQGN